MDSQVKAIYDTCLADLRKVVRDAFLEGNDARAIAILNSPEYKTVERKEMLTETVVLPVSYRQISPGEWATIAVRPQLGPFKAHRFAVSPRCASSFVIHDLRVGNKSIFPAAGTIDAMLLGQAPDVTWESVESPDETPLLTVRISGGGDLLIGIPLDFPSCQVAQDMVIMAQNIGAYPCQFYAMYLGTQPGRTSQPLY